jgi:hypothetical protein
MNLTRRKFIIGSLLVVSAPFIYKISLLSSDNKGLLELFFSKYKSYVSLDNIPEVSCASGIESFKTQLELLLIQNPEEYKWKLALQETIKKDYEDGKIEVVEGWILSETELCLELLKKQYV